MLPEILKAISGVISTSSFSNPAGHGINGVPAQATFKNMFNSLMSSLNGMPQSAVTAMPSGFGGMPNQAIGTYKNAMGQPIGQIPMQLPGMQGQFPNGIPAQSPLQFFANNFSHVANNKKQGRALPPGPMNSGSVVVNSGNNQFMAQMPTQLGAPSSALQALIGVGGGGSAPLQGFAGQAGQAGSPQGSFGNGSASPFPGQFLPGQGPAQATKLGGILSVFVMPLIGLFGAVKTLFQLRRTVGSMQPLRVHKDNLQYEQYNGYLDEVAQEEGSFDDYNHYIRKESDLVDDGPNYAQLQSIS